MSLIDNMLLILLGWLLGLFAPIIVGVIKDNGEAKATKIALFTELQELQYRLLLMLYKIEVKYGDLNSDFFKLAQDIFIKYKGVNSIDSLLKTIGPLLKLNTEEMAAYSQLAREQNLPDSGLELKKISLSLLESNLPLLTRFDPILRGHLLEIKTHVGFMNATVDDSRYYFRLSFQNNISKENYEIAHINMVNSYKTYASQARVVINFINKILPKERKQYNQNIILIE